MRKLIYGMNLTLDGYIAAPGDDLGWSGPSDELFQWWLDEELTIDLLLYGRKLWETMSSYWPTGDQQPGATPAQIAFARNWRDTPKVVFSSTIDKVDWNARLVAGDAVAEITRKEIVHGGVFAVSHRYWLGHLLEPCHGSKPLPKRLDDVGIPSSLDEVVAAEQRPLLAVDDLLPRFISPEGGHTSTIVFGDTRRVGPQGIPVHVHDRKVQKDFDRSRRSSGGDDFPIEREPVRVEKAKTTFVVLVSDAREDVA